MVIGLRNGKVDRHSTQMKMVVTKASQDKAYQDTLDEQQKESLRIDREPLLKEALADS